MTTRPDRFEDFLTLLADRFSPTFLGAAPTSRLGVDLGLDEVGMLLLQGVAEEVNPWFALPEQADLDHATLGDVFYHITAMGPEHHGEEG